MIVKLLLKVVFKACLPLLAMLGIVSYMMYMNGSDPLQVASRVLEKAGVGQSTLSRVQNGGLSGMASRAAEGVSGTFGSITDGFKSVSSDNPSSKTAYRWRNSDGTIQYGSVPPADAIEIREIKLSKAPEGSTPVVDGSTTSAGSTGTAMPASLPENLFGNLPKNLSKNLLGNLPDGVKLPENVDYNRILGQIDEP